MAVLTDCPRITDLLPPWLREKSNSASGVPAGVTVKTLLVARTVKPSFAKRRNSYLPGATERGSAKGHDPEVRGLPGDLEQPTYIHSMKALLLAPGTYKPIQSVALGETTPFQAAVNVPPTGILAGLATSDAVVEVEFKVKVNAVVFVTPPAVAVTVIG